MKQLIRKYGLILSILLHTGLLLWLLTILNQNRFQPTRIKGLELSYIPLEQLTIPLTTDSALKPSLSSANQKAKPGEINFKQAKPHLPAKLGANKIASHSLTINKSKISHKQPQLPLKTLPHSVSPSKVSLNQAATNPNWGGKASQFDSSSDGSGNESTVLDLRVIEYGRMAAIEINKNIVWPANYQYQKIKFRAYVTLDQNMQFEKLQIITSTGSPQLDASIIQALKTTIYPPLPPAANWRAYHELDFTINENDTE